MFKTVCCCDRCGAELKENEIHGIGVGTYNNIFDSNNRTVNFQDLDYQLCGSCVEQVLGAKFVGIVPEETKEAQDEKEIDTSGLWHDIDFTPLPPQDKDVDFIHQPPMMEKEKHDIPPYLTLEDALNEFLKVYKNKS